MPPITHFERKPAAHLINLLTATRAHHPNFTLFLGGGASVSSGVPAARTLIERWRKEYESIHGDGKIAGQPWCDSAEEYSTLFELLYDQPSQRREFIESCVCDARPSWGYIYLVNLLRHRVFNTVFTTNFDDLLNEACYSFSSDVRPIVNAHDSSVRTLRITSRRPKIIKLHRDFLFDSIKNTIHEPETLEANMKNKFKQFAENFGMVVVGYAGNDRSINSARSTAPRTESLVLACLRENLFGLLMSLNMLIEFGDAFDFTGAEFRDWCREAGFRNFDVMHLSGPCSAAIAWK